jgi:hypothetical protein
VWIARKNLIVLHCLTHTIAPASDSPHRLDLCGSCGASLAIWVQEGKPRS